MKKSVILVAALTGLFHVNAMAAEKSIGKCVSAWKKSPFKASANPDVILRPGVKVFGVGATIEDRDATSGPQLVLIKPAVNVLGKTTYRLMNPNGWYCFKANVSVLGKMEIEAHCKAHIATAADGANVLGADDSDSGVAVLGSIRVKRVGCAHSEKATETN